MLNNNNNFDNFFQPTNTETNYNDERISYKLTLRKQKIKETIYNKRGANSQSNYFDFQFDEIKNDLCNEKDILSGKFYNDLKKAYNTNNILELKNLLNSFSFFVNSQQMDILKMKELLDIADSSNNNKNKIEKRTFSPLCSLIFEIGINTEDKIIYLFSFKIILNFSYVSNDFCIEIINQKMINKIIEKLMHFFPVLTLKKIINHDNYKPIINNQEINNEDIEPYNFANTIFKLLGNLFMSVDSYQAFEEINFYEKIFYLLCIFDINSFNIESIYVGFDYFSTLIWLTYLIVQNLENNISNYEDKITMILPNILKVIKALYLTQETKLLEDIIDLIQLIIDFDDDNFIQKLIELDIINILSLLFGYLFPKEKNNGSSPSMDQKSTSIIQLNSDIVDKILIIFVNLFTVDSKYIKDLDLLDFYSKYEKLLDLYKLHHVNHYHIQDALVQILSNLACFEDVEQIVQKFMMNNKIIVIIFNYYYKYHKLQTLQFIDNILTKQSKEVKDFILNLGAFDIINKNICEYNGNDIEIINLSVKILLKLIKDEKNFNLNSFLEKIYKTSIPDKIKELYLNKDIQLETEAILKLIINTFENYEKTSNINI